MKNTTLMICVVAALAIFTSPADAAISRTHEINFDMMVPCVGEIVYLNGPIRVSLTFAGNSLTHVEYSVQGIRVLAKAPVAPIRQVQISGNPRIIRCEITSVRATSPSRLRLSGVPKATLTPETSSGFGLNRSCAGNLVRR